MDFENLCDPCLWAIGAMYGDNLLSGEKLAGTYQADEESLAWLCVRTEGVGLGGVEIG